MNATAASPAAVTSVTVRPIHSKADRKAFIDFQYAFYRESQFWVPLLRMDVEKTLDPKKNPFFAHGEIQLFLAEDANGKVLGRIAAIVNGMHLQKYDDGNGFFGFFECIEDYATAEKLFDAAAGWLRERGLTGMRGPTNPSLNDIAGLLVEGFERYPSLMMPYNPPYYAAYLTRYGFERAMTMWAYFIHYKYLNEDRLRRGAALVRRRNPNVTVRPIDMGRFDAEAQAVLHIYNEAWQDNWGHVPMTQAEFAKLAKDMKQIVDPGLIYLLEDDGTPIAFSIALPNLNQALRTTRSGGLLPSVATLLAYDKLKAIREMRVLLMGILPEYQGRALDVLLNLATIENGIRLGYECCEMSWVLDNNHRLRNNLETFGGTQAQEYGLYECSLA